MCSDVEDKETRGEIRAHLDVLKRDDVAFDLDVGTGRRRPLEADLWGCQGTPFASAS